MAHGWALAAVFWLAVFLFGDSSGWQERQLCLLAMLLNIVLFYLDLIYEKVRK